MSAVVNHSGVTPKTYQRCKQEGVQKGALAADSTPGECLWQQCKLQEEPVSNTDDDLTKTGLCD